MLVLEGKFRNRSVSQMGGQARLCTGPHALLHLPINSARRGFPRHGGWRLPTVLTERLHI